MSTRKSAKSVRKKSAKKAAKRSAKKYSARHVAIVDRDATLSPYGRNVLRAFRDGVQEAYARMATAGVAAAVMVDGKLVRAVPHREGGRFVVSESPAKQPSSRHRVG
jgi:hypothetical protein